jgi:diguanylate cyclase (GGDEF)-like protein
MDAMNAALNSLVNFLRLRRIGVRLAISNSILLLLFILVVSLTQHHLNGMAKSNEILAKKDIQRLLNVQALTLETEGVGGTLAKLFSVELKDRKPEYAAIDQKTKRIDDLIKILKTELVDEEQKAGLLKLEADHASFYTNFLSMLDELELHDAESAKKVFNRDVEPPRRALAESARLLGLAERERIDSRLQEERARLLGVQSTVIVLSIVAILLGGLLSYFTRRSIVDPLAKLELSALEIAGGNYASKVPPSKTIEIERVGIALNSMVTAIAQREQDIEQLAYYDSLTHIANRTHFLKDLEHANLKNHSLILMDIARLKIVNETLGFATGDTIILESSKRIQRALEKLPNTPTTFAKFAGGMFAVLFPDSNQEPVKNLFKEINTALNEPIHCGEHTVDVNFIYGVATSNSETSSSDSANVQANNNGAISIINLIRNAEVALYSAKGTTQSAVWYSEAQEASRLSHLSLLSDLRIAVLNSQLQMWLQPKILLSDMQTYGFEALVRWQHPQRGFISPIDFVPFAERTGYISSVTHWMLEQALVSLASWKEIHPALSIAVNVSTNDLRDHQFPDRVKGLLAKYDVNPQCLKLELTESGIMEDPGNAIPLLQKLRDTGIGLSIDDFGTGHSSLAYLQKLPVTELKIDRSFVINIDQHPATQRLVKTIIEMGHGLDLSVIAEGIETKEERDTLEKLGCDSMQGYFASKPLFGEGLKTWLSKL